MAQLDHWRTLLAEARKPKSKAISDDIDGLDAEARKGVKTHLHTLSRLLRSEDQELHSA